MPKLGFAIFPHLTGLAGAPQHQGHQLLAVANAQNGHAHLKNGGIAFGRSLFIDGGRAAGEDDARRGKLTDLLHRGVIGFDLAIDSPFPHTAGDEQIILPAEIQDQNAAAFTHCASSCWLKSITFIISQMVDNFNLFLASWQYLSPFAREYSPFPGGHYLQRDRGTLLPLPSIFA